MHLKVLLGTILISSCLPSAFGLSVTGLDQMVVFGDSLSDTGNVDIATFGLFPGDNYASGRFTNGPTTTPATSGPFGIWVDQMAMRLGVPDPQPFLAGNGGTDYAFASATTSSNGLYNIPDQVNYFLSQHQTGASATALYTIWGGSNDLFNGARNGSALADRLAGNIQSLAAAGAKDFLWFNIAPLGGTPLGNGDTTLTTAVNAFNSEWSLEIAALRSQGIDVTGVDVYSLFGSVAANPGAYGFTNITTPAQGLAGVNPNNYLFWDMEHLTTAGHGLVANLAFNQLVATPEPTNVGLALLGMGVLSVAIRRRRLQSGADHPARG